VSLVQDRPIIMLGPDAGSLTDYTCAFQTFQINQLRNLVVKPPTPSSPDIEQKAGAGSASVSVVFLSDYVTTSGLWQELLNAMATRTGELYFEYTPQDDTVGTSNPTRTGYIVVSDLDMGAPIGEARRQVKTFPARAISEPIVV
jgi:hypothetical protein